MGKKCVLPLVRLTHFQLYSLIHAHIYKHTSTKTQYQTQPEEGGAPKPPRAPRTDLSHLTEKEREDRHREQARLYGRLKRKQAAVTQTRLEKDLEQMRTYKEALNTAPFVMVVLSATINDYRVLYANKPVTEKLGFEVDKLLGRYGKKEKRGGR